MRGTPGSAASLLLRACALLALLAACDRPRSMGSVNNLVVAVPDSAWTALAPEIDASLEPRAFTVRDERIFDVAHVDPRDEEWGTLRLVRQVLVVGAPADPWMAEALDRLGGPAPAPPAVFQVEDVWALQQTVTGILLPPGSGPEAAGPLLPGVGEMLVDQLARYARARMFVTGVDSALADTLRARAGFSLLVPRVYRFASPRPGVFVFRNDNPDPADLIREVVVASRPRGEVRLDPAAAVEWRARLARELNDPVQLTADTLARAREVRVGGRAALEVQGVWINDPRSWPAAGPFIARLIECPERTFLVDAWLYAPADPKFEYMVQLQTILDTFACAG